MDHQLLHDSSAIHLRGAVSLLEKSGSEKRILKQTRKEILKKHTKISFLKSNTGKVNKEQEPLEERMEEEVCTGVEEEHIVEER